MPDVPSDYAKDGIDIDYRNSAELGQDLGAIIDWVKTQGDLPIWVIGMSAGSYSASNGAILLNEKIAGFGLCSASTNPSGSLGKSMPDGVIDLG